MTNKLRELHAESAELSKRIETLQRSNASEQTRPVDVVAKRTRLQAAPAKPRPRELWTTTTQRTRQLAEIEKDREKLGSRKPEPSEVITKSLCEIASIRPEQAEEPVNTSDAVAGTTFEGRKITELPLSGSNVENLLSLQPGKTWEGFVPGGRADQSNITLDGVDLFEPYSLIPRNTGNGGETNIRLKSSVSWIRFELALETAATQESYRVIIRTADDRFVTSVDWIEPLTPNQTIIDTPVILTNDLPSGDYLLFLMGKELDGSFVKVGEYSFIVVRY